MIGFSVETAVKDCASAHYRKVCVALLTKYYMHTVCLKIYECYLVSINYLVTLSPARKPYFFD